MNKLNYKKIQFFLILISLLVLAASFYLQYFLNLHPCPLCLMQRLCVFVLLVLMGLSLNTIKKARRICFFQIFVAAAGLFFALRQIWLQSLPPDAVPACMPGLDILIHYFPWQDVMKSLFWGTGDCAENTWKLWGISLACWCALYFLFVQITSIFLYLKTRKLFGKHD